MCLAACLLAWHFKSFSRKLSEPQLLTQFSQFERNFSHNIFNGKKTDSWNVKLRFFPLNEQKSKLNGQLFVCNIRFRTTSCSFKIFFHSISIILNYPLSASTYTMFSITLFYVKLQAAKLNVVVLTDGRIRTRNEECSKPNWRAVSTLVISSKIPE